ncbi:MAG: hypothetical protein AAB973_01255 [Patescibacteria group bacterium]
MSTRQRPYFIWDYDLTEDDVRVILRSQNQTDKVWMLSRILESARFEDVWKYTSLSEVKQMFPLLKIKKPIRQAWGRALSIWQ